MAVAASNHRNIPTKAFVVSERGASFTLQDVILDGARPDEVLVEMKYTGICHTDLVVQAGGMPIGQYPAILGHEGVGIVKHIGDNVPAQSLKPGDAVILSFRTCQTCQACRAGTNGACPSMTEYNFVRARREVNAPSPVSLPGGNPVHGQFFGQSSMSKLAVVDAQSVVRVDDVDSEDLRWLPALGCGYLTGAGTVMDVLRPQERSSIVLAGMGAVGLAALLAAKHLGVRKIIAVDMVGEKLQIARDLGATDVIDTKKEGDLAEAVRGVCPEGPDYALDTTGVTVVQQALVQSLGHGGALACVGVPKPGAEIKVDALDLLVSCKRILGVIEGFSNPKTIIPRLIQLYREGKFPIDRLGKVYPAQSLEDAINDLKAGAVVKPVISWEAV